ncbi:MAG: iron-containing alcohol dehydrogenase [Lachnospiraceae bacterium]|nr:iron-containing alcohol dehydrogenase [Lachnospiraceae bacterium]
MFIAKRAYCRIFQTAFRIAIPVLPYRKPEIIEGFSGLIPLLKKQQISSVLLVTDAGIRKAGLTSPLEELLAEAEIHCSIYDKTTANPTVDNVEEAAKQYTENGCQVIIALGGGSSIDCAKACGARIAKPRQSLAQMKGLLKIHKKLPTLIAIPTTAGTGSETTLAAVITDPKSHHKYPINDFCLIPRYAVLDPQITRSLPPALTASTGMDALTHAVEAYIGRSTTRQTREDALTAVSLIFENLSRAYHDGNDLEARKNMLHAAYLAGSAFTVSYVGYVHAVAHSLGGRYGTPHGLANAILLPYVLEAYGPSAHKKLHELAKAAGLCDGSESHEEGAKRFIQAVQDMKQEYHLEDSSIRVAARDIPRLSYFASKEANPLYPVPKLMNRKELEQFYYPFAQARRKEHDA